MYGKWWVASRRASSAPESWSKLQHSKYICPKLPPYGAGTLGLIFSASRTGLSKRCRMAGISGRSAQ